MGSDREREREREQYIVQTLRVAQTTDRHPVHGAAAAAAAAARDVRDH